MRSLGLLILLAACASPPEWRREYDGYLPDMAGERVAVLLVLDRETGEPVKGAVVRQHGEGDPSGEGDWAEVLAEKRTDEFGLVWFELSGQIGMYHWAVHADGYASAEEIGGGIDETVELERGATYRGRLLDPFGKPLVGAVVESILGCPHSPAMRVTQTDSEGLFEFHGVLEGSWPWFHAGVESAYAAAAKSGYPVPVTVASPTRPIEGRIFWADGSAPHRAYVMNDCSPRGPLVRLGRDGRFRIEGGNVRGDFTVYFPEDWVRISARNYRPGGPFTHRIGAEERAFSHGITISAEHSVPVVFERIEDGRSWSGRTNQGHYLPEGEYRIVAGGPFSRFVGEIPRQRPAQGHSIPMSLREQPRLEIDWGDLEPDERFARLHLPDTASAWGNEELPRYLPARSPAVLLVESEGARRFFPVGPEQDGVRPVRVRMPGRKRLAVPGLLDGYWMYGTNPDLDRSTAPTEGELWVRATGPALVETWGESEVRHLTFDLPERSDATVEPTAVRIFALPPERRLRLAVGPAQVIIANESVDAAWRVHAETHLDVGEDGEVASPWFRAGARIAVYPDGQHVPRRVTLHGDGPYEVSWGDASIRLPDEEYRVYMDGLGFGYSVLRGLDPGPHTLIVAKPGKRPVVMRIVLKPGEERRIQPIE